MAQQFLPASPTAPRRAPRAATAWVRGGRSPAARAPTAPGRPARPSSASVRPRARRRCRSRCPKVARSRPLDSSRMRSLFKEVLHRFILSRNFHCFFHELALGGSRSARRAILGVPPRDGRRRWRTRERSSPRGQAEERQAAEQQQQQQQQQQRRGTRQRGCTRGVGGDPRWRSASSARYSAADVIRLRGTVQEEHTLAGWAPSGCGSCCTSEDYVNALGALTGNQAMQQVRAGLKAIYLSGWQVAADANLAGADVSRTRASIRPTRCRTVVRRINNALQRADQIELGRGQATGRAALVRPDRRRRGGRLRRPAQRLRADEGDDRGGRGGRPLRGPARVGEEVRPPRRQGADPDRAASSAR